MAVDPNEMLIFKLRGMKATEKEEQQSSETQKTGTQIQQQTTPAVPMIEKPQEAPVQKVEAPVMQQEVKKQPEQPAQQVQTQAPSTSGKGGGSSLITGFFKKQGKNAKKEEKAREEVEEEATISEYYKSINRMTGEPMPDSAMEAPRGRGKKQGMNRNIEGAKELTCTNHPWRPAYSLCEFCKRPFCYADLVTYNNNLYCLEDIDKVSANSSLETPTPLNMFANFAAGGLIINSLILGYFIYPQTLFFINYAIKIGVLNFISSLNYYYGIGVVNLILVVLGLLSGILIFAKSRKGFFFGGLVAGISLALMSYEYLNSSVSYLFVTTALSFAIILLLIYSRMSSVQVQADIDEMGIKPTGVEWPKAEVY